MESLDSNMMLFMFKFKKHKNILLEYIKGGILKTMGKQ